MHITPVINTSYNYSINRNIKQKPNFTAHYDRGQINELVGDGVIYKRGNIHNFSYLARNLQLFLEMPQILEERFPNGVKIYDYGCSTGYEPSSIVLGLHNHFPEDKVSNYTPIIARDSNPQAIKAAKQCRLRFESDEIYKLNFFENINKDDFLIPRRRGRDGQKIYDYTDKLKNEIIYEDADLFEDLDSGKLSKEPCVILLRNAWQFMTPTGQKTLADKLYSKLPPKSMVIIGSCDILYDANKSLMKSGFKNIEDDYDMQFNNKVLTAQYKNEKALNPVRTKHFCFVKE